MQKVRTGFQQKLLYVHELRERDTLDPLVSAGRPHPVIGSPSINTLVDQGFTALAGGAELKATKGSFSLADTEACKTPFTQQSHPRCAATVRCRARRTNICNHQHTTARPSLVRDSPRHFTFELVHFFGLPLPGASTIRGRGIGEDRSRRKLFANSREMEVFHLVIRPAQQTSRGGTGRQLQNDRQTSAASNEQAKHPRHRKSHPLRHFCGDH